MIVPLLTMSVLPAPTWPAPSMSCVAAMVKTPLLLFMMRALVLLSAALPRLTVPAPEIRALPLMIKSALLPVARRLRTPLLLSVPPVMVYCELFWMTSVLPTPSVNESTLAVMPGPKLTVTPGDSLMIASKALVLGTRLSGDQLVVVL